MRLTASGLLLLLVCHAGVAADGRMVDEASGFQFPAEIAGFTYAESKVYDAKADGYSVRYFNAEGVKVDIYLYDAEEKGITPGPAGAGVANHFQVAEGALNQALKMGLYSSVNKDAAGASLLEKGQPGQFLVGRYTLGKPKGKDGAPGKVLDSLLLLTGLEGRFLKVRCSANAGHQTDFAEILGLAAVLRAGLSTPAGLAESPANNRKILALIAAVYERPLADDTQGRLAVILRYAEAAEKIFVVVNPALFDLKDPHATLYLGMFTAGCVKFDLEHPAKANVAGADTPEAVRFQQRLYAALRKKDPAYTSTFYAALK